MNRNRSACSFIAAITLSTGALSPAWAADYTFTNLIDSSGPYDSFDAPALNNAGQVATFAYTDAYEPVILRTNGTTTVVIADTHGPFFSLTGCGTFQLMNVPSIRDNGAVAFRALRGDCWTGAVQGIYVGTGGPATEIVEDDEPQVVGLWTHPSINATGMVAFRASMNGSRDAIMCGSGGQPAIVVDTDGALASLGDPTINDGGCIAANATYDTGGVEAIIRCVGGVVTVIADSGGPLASFANQPDINNTGQIAFRAMYDDGWTYGIFKGDGAALTLVAGTAAAVYSDVQSPSINDGGTVAFFAVENMYNPGIFTGPNPVTDKVVMRGDMLFGSPVTHVSFGVAGLNDNGQIAFSYSLEDGRTGIALATPSAVLRGDLNCDGFVTSTDVAAFVRALADPAGYAAQYPSCSLMRGDMNNDGQVDGPDIQPFVNLLLTP